MNKRENRITRKKIIGGLLTYSRKHPLREHLHSIFSRVGNPPHRILFLTFSFLLKGFRKLLTDKKLTAFILLL